ncbi:hypothetical protein ACFL1K_03155 [Candidatus Omnitrophota bacterium]
MLQNQRAVSRSGNRRALKVLREVFKKTDASWRGLGVIPASGLGIRSEFGAFNAEKFFSFARSRSRTSAVQKRCRCGDVLKGLILPTQCPLFFKACRPDNPVGPCMVSSEGACNAYYKYRRWK